MLFVSKTFSLSPLSVLPMKLLYHEAKLASLSYILVLMYIYATLQPTRLLTYLLKSLHLHFLRSMHSQDVTRLILLVTSRTNRSCFRLHVLLYDRKSSSLPSTDEAKSSSLTRPALLKRFKGTANHAGHIWSQQALVPSISVPSLQDWGWISLRGEWRLFCTPLSKITKLRVELVKYARKKGYSQKSDNRERQSPTLSSITSTRLHEVSSH